MDTIELQGLLDKSVHLKHLDGVVCSRDMLPKKRPPNIQAYIVNTHKSNQPGEHWVAIFFKGNWAYYFDSYGRPPPEENILPFIKQNARCHTYNKHRLQEGSTPVCGMYCIFALDFLAKGCNLDDIIQIKFNLKAHGLARWENDRELIVWFKKYYGPLYENVKSIPKDPQNICQICKFKIDRFGGRGDVKLNTMLKTPIYFCRKYRSYCNSKYANSSLYVNDM